MSMIELVVSPLDQLPSSVDLVVSDTFQCNHSLSETPVNSGTPMVQRVRSFRADVAVGGWCALPRSFGEDEEEPVAKHSHVHAYEQHYRDPNWRP